MSHLLDPIAADPTNSDPRPATSERRQAASRANGAKSHGPVTPEGKARSSKNAIKHGLLADVIVLEQEDPEVFEAFAAELHDYLRPTNPVAKMLVDDLVAAHWRRTRIRRIEAETLNIGIDAHIPESFDAQHAAAKAFRDLTDATPSLQLLNRYERGFDRQIVRTLRLLPKWNQPGDEASQMSPSCPNDDGEEPEAKPACGLEEFSERNEERNESGAREPGSETPHAAACPDALASPHPQPCPGGEPSATVAVAVQSQPACQELPNEPRCPAFSTPAGFHVGLDRRDYGQFEEWKPADAGETPERRAREPDAGQ